MRCFTLHSYKGGTGKTTLAANIAAILAQEGRNVALLDLDFQAPSLHTLIGMSPKTKYINDFLDQVASHQDVLTNISSTFKLKGTLSVAFSNPDVDAIRAQLARDRKWHMKALSQLLSLKQELSDDGYDYIILDSAPGVHYSSVNAIVLSDFTVIISKIDNFDFDGTLNILNGLYTPLDKGTYLLFNKVVPPLFKEPRYSQMKETISEMFGGKTTILGYVPCYCDIPLGMGSEIHALTNSDLAFVTGLKEVARKIEELPVPKPMPSGDKK